MTGGWCYGGFKATPASGWLHALHDGARRAAPVERRVHAGAFRRRPDDRRKGRGAAAGSAWTLAMLLIPCPWCGPRNQVEFTYGGDATLKRPPQDAPMQAWYDFVYLRDNPCGAARRAVAAQRRVPALVQAAPRHAHARHPCERPARSGVAGARVVTQSHRLAQGGIVDRSRALRFRFDGAPYEGYPGDTLASALLANGVHLVARSFKYHRPRGILAAGADEPNALVQLGARRTHRAEHARDPAGALRRARRGEPEPLAVARFDVGALNDAARRCFPAGFYYKTFMWPPSALVARVRARDPPRRRPRPRAARARSRSLRTSASRTATCW